jgi:phosphatidylserine/phosphatidylglycerophosphate/cardiolipin synthase-like enzyme
MKVDARSLVRAWRLVRAAGVELFSADAPGRLEGLRGPQGLAVDPTVELSLLTALRALEIEHSERPSDLARVTLVATLPTTEPEVAATRDVVRGLIRGAVRELLVVGFSMTDPEFHALLAKRACEGVQVTVVGDRTSGDLATMKRGWPVQARPLVALVEALPERDEFRRMHGKVIVADRARALVGSANFSAGGLRANLEFGLRVEGSVAEELCRLVSGLKQAGWLVDA